MASLNGFRVVTLIVAVIIVSSGLGFFGGTVNQHTETSVSTSTVSTEITAISPITFTLRSTTTSTPPAQTTTIHKEVNVTLAVPFPSLELSARATPANITSGENVTIVAEVYNSLPETVAMEAPAIKDYSESFCPLNSPTAITLYPGHYTFSNITGVVYLLEYNGSYEGSCSTAAAIGYTFLPNSDEATLQAMPPNNLHPPPIAINETTSLSGYWGNFAGEQPLFQEFAPGQYTVLVVDAWGQEALCYFTVS